MNQGIAFNPLLPWPQVTFLLLASVAISTWLYRHQDRKNRANKYAWTLTALRLTGIAVLMLLLFNPVFTDAGRKAGNPPLAILFDASRSMRTRDVGAKSRFDAGRDATLDNKDLMTSLNRRFNCKVFSMSDTAKSEDMVQFMKAAKPTGDRTMIGESLAAVLSSMSTEPNGGILLVSDGRNNGEIDPVQTARLAKSRRFPIFTLSLGSSAHGRDVAVYNRRPQVYAAPNQQIPLSVDIKSVGYTGSQAQLTLSLNGRQVQTRSITLEDHRAITESFNVQQAKEGSYRYTVSLAPLDGEAITTNNTCNIFLQVHNMRSRVLLLEGRPSWDAKFLIQTLHNDPSMDVDAIFKLSDQKTFAVTEPSAHPNEQVVLKTPRTAADFAKYDVVIIGKGYEEFFDAKTTDALKTFVGNHSGNVIFLRGNPGYTPDNLAALMPLKWTNEEVQDLRVQVTDEGKRHPAFDFPMGSDPNMVVQKLPNLISASKVEQEGTLSVVLARAANVSMGPQEMAVLAYQNYGQGKAVSLVGQGLWRWAMLPPSLKDYSACYSDFWTQLIRWLVYQSDFLPGQDISLKTDRAKYTPDQTVTFMAFTRGNAKAVMPNLIVTRPDGQTQTVPMTRGTSGQADFTGSMKVKTPGEYLAQIPRGAKAEPLMTPFSVYPNSDEDLITAADPEMMRMIANAGGGKMLEMNDLHDFPALLKQSQQHEQVNMNPRTAWNKPPLLAFILLLFCCEWALRRRWGLL